MSAGPMQWRDVFHSGARVLVIVNSAASQVEEIERTIVALGGSTGLHSVSLIAPAALKPWLIHRGVDASSILVPRVAGLEVEFGDFLERPRAVDWAVGRHVDIVLGTEPYPPRNEDAKLDFERRVVPMLGGAQFVVHSLPRDEVFAFNAEDLWNRAALDQSKAMHQARLHAAVDRLHAHWSLASAAGHDHKAATLASAALGSVERPPDDAAPRVAARRYALDQLWDALRQHANPSDTRVPRILVQPPGAAPGAGWLPGAVRPVRRPAQTGKGVKLHGTRLAIRGEVEGPYSYLVMSRPANLRRGDAVMAEGHVYRGGVTIGLVRGDAWASRVDVDAPGPFLAAAIATEAGPHALVVANCLKGDERNAAVVLRRFGWVQGR